MSEIIYSLPARYRKAGLKFWRDKISKLGMEGFGISAKFYENHDLENIVIYERKSGDHFILNSQGSDKWVKKAKNNSVKVNHGKLMYVVPVRFFSKIQVLTR